MRQLSRPCAAAGLVLLLSAFAHAQIPAPIPVPGIPPIQAPPPPPKPTIHTIDGRFLQNLVDYVSPMVSTVSNGRELHVWHWGGRTSVLAGQSGDDPITHNPNPDPSKTRDPLIAPMGDRRVFNHVNFLKNTFHTARGFGLAGPGFYAAIDPESTSSSGQMGFSAFEDWVVFQLVLRPGVRFIDLAKDKGMSQELKDQVNAFGCLGATDPRAIFQQASILEFGEPGLPDPAPDSPEARCRVLRDRIVEITKTSAMKYHFGSAIMQGCDERSTFAFVIWGDDDFVRHFNNGAPGALNLNTMVTFIPQLPAQGDVHQLNRMMISEMFNRANHPLQPFPLFTGLTTPLLQTPQGRLIDLTTWMRQNIMNCAKGRFPEDANPPPITF